MAARTASADNSAMAFRAADDDSNNRSTSTTNSQDEPDHDLENLQNSDFIEGRFIMEPTQQNVDPGSQSLVALDGYVHWAELDRPSEKEEKSLLNSSLAIGIIMSVAASLLMAAILGGVYVVAEVRSV